MAENRPPHRLGNQSGAAFLCLKIFYRKNLERFWNTPGSLLEHPLRYNDLENSRKLHII